ncbi:hypothetical protein ACOTC5_32160 [Achromobacter xylosoxidans]
MHAYFCDATTEARYSSAQLQHSHLPDVMFDVSLVSEEGLKLVVSLPLETKLDPNVLLKCAKDSGNEDCYYHPNTGEILYLVYDGCEPDHCYTLADLIALRTPGKGLEFDVQADKVTIF